MFICNVKEIIGCLASTYFTVTLGTIPGGSLSFLISIHGLCYVFNTYLQDFFFLSEQINYNQEKERIFTLCFLTVKFLFQ